MKKILFTLFICLLGITSTVKTEAANEIGQIVALKGRAITERNNASKETKLKDDILIIDTVSTREASKTKILFVDDSVLTIGENTRLSVKEFVYRKEDRGRSIFNLIDGKMRAVVGRTNFEVQTPTLVAAARGTVIYIETGIEFEKPYTTVLSLEGAVEIRLIDPTVTGTVVLSPGMMITVRANEPMPSPSAASNAVVRAAGMGNAAASQAATLTAVGTAPAIAETLRSVTMAPTIDQLPAKIISPNPGPPPPVQTPVNIGVTFPGPAPVNVGIVFH